MIFFVVVVVENCRRSNQPHYYSYNYNDDQAIYNNKNFVMNQNSNFSMFLAHELI